MYPLCKNCNKELSHSGKHISILLINGNEETFVLWYCSNCKKYFILGYEDVFISADEEKEWFYGEYSEEDFKRLEEIINKCPDPSDKFCRCDAHKYFYRFIYGKDMEE
ncbi:MAG: hypothetical protein ABIL39_02185 [candidate division WOR-3 bacterium]